MITTAKLDITWEGKPAIAMANASERKIKDIIKGMTGAVDVEIIEVNSWTEEGDEKWDE